MDNPEELKIVETMGLEIVGFLQLLRIQMGKFSGYGIQVNNNDIKKALSNIEIDYSIDREHLFYLYEQLKEKGIIILIYDSHGNEYATTVQQLFNWEYKMYERVLNKNAKKKQRDKEKTGYVDFTQEESIQAKGIPADNSTTIGSKQSASTDEEIPCEPLEEVEWIGSEFDDITDSGYLQEKSYSFDTDDTNYDEYF